MLSASRESAPDFAPIPSFTPRLGAVIQLLKVLEYSSAIDGAFTQGWYLERSRASGRLPLRSPVRSLFIPLRDGRQSWLLIGISSGRDYADGQAS